MIIQNAIKFNEEIFNSTRRHDWRGHPNCYVDGGLDYIRRCIPKEGNVEDLTLDINSSFEEVCDKLLWGSNKEGWIKIKDIRISDLKMIIEDTNDRLVKLVCGYHLKKLESEQQ